MAPCPRPARARRPKLLSSGRPELFFAFSSNLSYALVGSVLRHWLAQGQRLLAFNRCMAVVLTATAGWIVWSLKATA